MFPPSCLSCSQTTVEVMKIIVIFFKMSHVCIATLSVPNTAPGHHQFTPLPGTPGHSQASLGQSLVGSLLPSPGSWCAHFVCVLQESLSLALKFWWLYGGVNGDFLQEGLFHSQVCCTQSSCRCSRPLLTHTSSGDTQSSGSVSVGSLGPGMHKVLFVPSKSLFPQSCVNSIISIRKMHWLVQGLRKVKFSWNQVLSWQERMLKETFFNFAYGREKNLDTCSLFPPVA